MFEKIKAFVTENKETVIQVGAVLAGAILGGVVAAFVGGRTEDGPMIDMLDDEEVSDVDDDDFTTDV